VTNALLAPSAREVALCVQNTIRQASDVDVLAEFIGHSTSSASSARARRRSRLAGLIALVTLVASGGARAFWSQHDERPRPRPPNVVVIITDDQRFEGTLQVMPAIRRLVKDRGETFTNAFATTPMCCPSRATIFTGRYAHNHGLTIDAKRNKGALDKDSTIQAVLRAKGYKTAIYGKYLNRWDLSDDPPYFDSWGIFANTRAAGDTAGKWNVEGRVRRVDEYSTTFIRRRGEAFMHRWSSKDHPWLLFLSTAAPHDPATPERRYRRAPVPKWRSPWRSITRNAGSRPDVVKRSRKDDRIPELRRRQLRTLMLVDDLVASTMQTLRETKQDRDTFVIFLSDNGFMWNE
jgi:arylsulfatase A-like enzyme